MGYHKKRLGKYYSFYFESSKAVMQGFVIHAVYTTTIVRFVLIQFHLGPIVRTIVSKVPFVKDHYIRHAEWFQNAGFFTKGAGGRISESMVRGYFWHTVQYLNKGLMHAPRVLQNIAYAWFIVAIVAVVANIFFIRMIVKQRKDFEEEFEREKNTILK